MLDLLFQIFFLKKKKNKISFQRVELKSMEMTPAQNQERLLAHIDPPGRQREQIPHPTCCEGQDGDGEDID